VHHSVSVIFQVIKISDANEANLAGKCVHPFFHRPHRIISGYNATYVGSKKKKSPEFYTEFFFEKCCELKRFISMDRWDKRGRVEA
jgi:hypothetical protein